MSGCQSAHDNANRALLDAAENRLSEGHDSKQIIGKAAAINETGSQRQPQQVGGDGKVGRGALFRQWIG